MPSLSTLHHRLAQFIGRAGLRSDERGEMRIEPTLITAALIGLTVTALAAAARILGW